MIRSENSNTTILSREMLVAHHESYALEPIEIDRLNRRIGIGKSKSVGHIELHTSISSIDVNSNQVISSTRTGTRGHARVYGVDDTRASKLEWLSHSPRKPERHCSFRNFVSPTNERSPSSVTNFDVCSTLKRPESKMKHSLSMTDNMQFQDTSAALKKKIRAFQSSRNGSDEESLVQCSESVRLDSIPVYFRISTSNLSVHSDLSESIPILDLKYFSPERIGSKKPKPSTAKSTATENDNMNQGAVDCTPLPPKRHNSGRHLLNILDDADELYDLGLAIDSSPQRPARQSSQRTLHASSDLERSVTASITQSQSSSDLAPTKPNRRGSGSVLSSNELSQDSSPLKPQRQSSVRKFSALLPAIASEPASSADEKRSPRRSICRSESSAGESLNTRPRHRGSFDESVISRRGSRPNLISRSKSGTGETMIPRRSSIAARSKSGKGETMIPRRSSMACPPRRTIARSESTAQPRLPALVRRESMTVEPETTTTTTTGYGRKPIQRNMSMRE